MDIISEILEADRLAEEQLAAAEEKRRELLDGCEAEIQRIKTETDEILDEYRSNKRSRIKAQTDDRTRQLKEEEKKKTDAFEKLYRINHETWENEIFDAILGRS